MAFDEKDISVLKQMFDDQSRDLRDFTRQEIAASETRLSNRFDSKLDSVETRLTQKIEDTEARLISAMSESHEMLVEPRLIDHELRIAKLENIPVR